MNTITRIAVAPSAKYATPMFERLVYGLVYPAVLGASLVEFGVRTHVFASSIPWLLLMLVFVVDFCVTASESSESPPIGNLFIALADLVAAGAFLGAYIVSVAWDGSTPFTGSQLHRLVYVVLGLHLAYVLWYAFRWATKDAAGVVEELQDDYLRMLKGNALVAGGQTVAVVALAWWILSGRGDVGTYYVMMPLVLAGLCIRVYRDRSMGPICKGS